MHEFLVSAAAFIVLIGLIVVLHELGHFVVAKLCGVRVEAFSFGFGPRLFGINYGGTDYKVCLLPFGGYVKMTGEAAEQNLQLGEGQAASDTDTAGDPGSLLAHPRWQRMLIGLAGPAVNLLFAVFLMFVYYAFINEVPAVTVPTTTVEWVTPGSPAAQAGIESGDVVLSFAGLKNPNWEPQVYEQIKLNPGQSVPVEVRRGGQTLNLALHIPPAARQEDFDIGDTGLQPQYFAGPIVVDSVLPDSGAERAGLQAGDKIAAIDGHDFHSIYTLLAYMQWEQGKPMKLTLLRNGAALQLTATPTRQDATHWLLGFRPQPPPFRDEPLALTVAGKKSVLFLKNNSLLVAQVLKGLFTHRLSVTQFMGPVGIAKVAGEAAEVKGWLPKFDLASQISLQLGIFNLLPFPILDGGMILLLVIESGLRHDISLVIKERIYTAAFVVLMAFMAFVIFNDVSRLGLFGHFRP